MLLSRRQLLKFTASAAAIAGLPASARAAGVRFETGAAFGSTWRLVLPDAEDAPFACSQFEAIVERVDRLMSPFRPDSEVALFNGGDRQAITLSSETRLVCCKPKVPVPCS
jgi:thiamine biosynthesis lipoprotein ApbE